MLGISVSLFFFFFPLVVWVLFKKKSTVLISAVRILVCCSCASRQRSHDVAIAFEFFSFWQHLQFSYWDLCECRNPRGGKACTWTVCWEIIRLTPLPAPHGKVLACACAFESYLFALQRVSCKTLSENMLLESLLKNGGLKPERSYFTAPLSWKKSKCRKKYSLNTSDIYFVLALHKSALPPWAGRSGHVCVWLCFQGEPCCTDTCGPVLAPLLF